MKKLTSILALILCLSFCVAAFASCGKKSTDGNATEPATEAATTPATTPATEAATTPATTPKTNAATDAATDAATKAATDAAPATDPATEPATEAKTEPATEPATEPETEPATEPATVDWDSIGAEVSAYDSADRLFRIQYDTYVSAENIPQNNKYLQGPDELTPTTSEIETMVYDRNRAAAELFGLTLEYKQWDSYAWGKQAEQIVTLVNGSDPDSPDLYVDMLYDLNKAMKTSGVFKDIRSIPGSFFDFEAEGWMKDWMESLSFTLDRAYIMGSDYFLELFRAMGVMPFNIDLMDNNGEKLAKALFDGEVELDDGEEFSTYFFDFVEDDNWTWDALGKLCTAIYVDTDADSQDSFDDVLGIVTDRYSGLPGSLMVFSSGIPVTETYTIEDPESEYNGKIWVRYFDNTAAIGSIFDAVAGVFNGRGSLVTNYNPDSGKTMQEHYTKFSEDTLLFAGTILLGALENEAFQTMSSTWSVVPVPKVGVEQEYNTVIHNTGDAGAMSVRTTPDKARALSAFLQYCSVNSVAIREEFQQIVTKFKTTTYNQGTDRMLDIIYENVITGRDKALEDVAQETNGKTTASWLKASEFVGGSDYVVSRYNSELTERQAKLDRILTKWYALPTSSSETPEE